MSQLRHLWEGHHAECRNSECRWADCHYERPFSDCHCTECHGALPWIRLAWKYFTIDKHSSLFPEPQWRRKRKILNTLTRVIGRFICLGFFNSCCCCFRCCGWCCCSWCCCRCCCCSFSAFVLFLLISCFQFLLVIPCNNMGPLQFISCIKFSLDLEQKYDKCTVCWTTPFEVLDTCPREY